MESKELTAVKAFIKAINAQDVAAMKSLMTEDHAFIDADGGVQAGRNVMAQNWREYFRMFPDYTIHVDDIIQKDNLLAIFGETSGTYAGTHGPQPENKVGGPAAWKVMVERGKIKLWQVYADYSGTIEVMQNQK